MWNREREPVDLTCYHVGTAACFFPIAAWTIIEDGFIEADDVTRLETLNWIDTLQEKIMQGQGGDGGAVYSTNSIVDFLEMSPMGMPTTQDGVETILAMTPDRLKKNFINDDLTAANLLIGLRVLNGEETDKLKNELESYIVDTPEGVKAEVTGTVVIDAKMTEALNEGRQQMTVIGGLFVFAGLVVLFRLRWIRAMMAMLPIILIIGWSSVVMYAGDIVYTPVTATLGALIIGIGVEFTVLLMMRYYEEKEKGQRPTEAMITSMTRIGRAIIASGLTVVGGF